MSTVDLNVKAKRYLTEPQRRAIIAEVSAGRPQVQVAKQFGVHPNTVNVLIRAVRKASNVSASDWKRDLYERMVPQSVAAIGRSVNDLNDVHKAAGTAMAHLKAVGVVKDESNVTTNIFVNVQDLPEDWYSRMRPVNPEDRLVIDATPEESSG